MDNHATRRRIPRPDQPIWPRADES